MRVSQPQQSQIADILLVNPCYATQTKIENACAAEPNQIDAPIYIDSTPAIKVLGNPKQSKRPKGLEAQPSRKPFYGGYVNRISDVVYHHAETQTDPSPKEEQQDSDNTTCGIRIHMHDCTTQMVPTVNKGCQPTHHNCYTQMEIRDYHMDGRIDRHMPVGDYVHSDEIMRTRHMAATKIQARARCHLVRNASHRRREERVRLKWEEQDEKERLERAELERRINPKISADFAILREELAQWHASEVDRINEADHSPAIRRAFLADLLSKEVLIIRAIEKRQARTARSEGKRTERELGQLAKPLKWRVRGGLGTGAGQGFVDVRTPEIDQAYRLNKVYFNLVRDPTNRKDRVDVLYQARDEVEMADFGPAREVADLIDREMDLISRHREKKSMTGLRIRLQNLFLQLIKTPLFNPASSQLNP